MNRPPMDSTDGYEWTEITTWAGDHIAWVRGCCPHDAAVPVESGGVTVAWLCLTCDAQLSGGSR